MPWSPESTCCTDVLFCYVLISRVENNEAKGTLTITALSGERERQKIVYQNVLYSQIGKESEGKRIAIAEELTPEELRSNRHRAAAQRFIDDCSLKNLNTLEKMMERGYHFYTHYIGEKYENIVVAKSLCIS